ncbi:hypothetical protein FA95DRAFT_1613551 [Auriscalpium vulgare]|uniref:Uncharacterized protein n=1 Tax=Auriscalpium vulgare TaxID=40419 RepID=A0ACB8R3M2_9AGAM|nr:hypothetical protein FA95DRAFT_1613551 [Auriscalpium vulgare]
MANPAEPHIQSLAIALAGFVEVILHYTPLNSQSQASVTHLRFSSSPLVSALIRLASRLTEKHPNFGIFGIFRNHVTSAPRPRSSPSGFTTAPQRLSKAPQTHSK